MEFYTIGQVSKRTNTPASKLRFWETKIDTLKPTYTETNRRMYTEDHIVIIEKIIKLSNHGIRLDAINKKLNKEAVSKQDGYCAVKNTAYSLSACIASWREELLACKTLLTNARQVY